MQEPNIITNHRNGMSGGKPEMVRTTAFLVAPLRLCVAGGQKDRGWHFRPPFLWFISFGGAKEMNNMNFSKNEVVLHPNYVSSEEA
ncbi:MAG: hypothetical protein MUF36_05245 [Bacteroidales bacterium]|jgi:hypothetical protein|nr:hypothetical protein [Bacteroidales bacterium]